MKKAFFYISGFIISALSVYALHDMQTAQGIGYYFALKTGSGSRLFFDIAADLAYLFMFAVMLSIPLFTLKCNNKARFSRFLLLYTALMPALRADYVFSLFSGRDFFKTGFSLSVFADSLLEVLRITVPLLILAAAFDIAIKGNRLSLSLKILPVIAAVPVIVCVLVPALTSLCAFVSAYLIIYVIFAILEKNEFDSLWFYMLLFFTAVYRLLSVTAAWSL